jgi:hypothetical protein
MRNACDFRHVKHIFSLLSPFLRHFSAVSDQQSGQDNQPELQ